MSWRSDSILLAKGQRGFLIEEFMAPLYQLFLWCLVGHSYGPFFQKNLLLFLNFLIFLYHLQIKFLNPIALKLFSAKKKVLLV